MKKPTTRNTVQAQATRSRKAPMTRLLIASRASLGARRSELLVALATLGLLCVPGDVAADEPLLPPELKALCSRMEAKAGQGKKTEADFADELKALDTMLARRAGEKTADVAWMLFIKARMYDNVLTNQDIMLTNKAKAEAIDAQLKREFPDFAVPKLKAEDLIDLKGLRKQILFASNGLDEEVNAMKIQAALQPGTSGRVRP